MAGLNLFYDELLNTQVIRIDAKRDILNTLPITDEQFITALRTMANSITFDGETLNIELKDTLRALQRVKHETNFDPKIEQNRTPSNPVIATKKTLL